MILKKILPLVLGLLINEVIYYQNLDSFIYISAVYCLLLLSDTSNYMIYMSLWQYIDNNYVKSLRLKLFNQIMHAKSDILSNLNTGDVISIINNDSHEFLHVIQRNVFRFINAWISILISGIIILLISYKIFLLMVIAVPVSFVVSIILQKKIQKISFRLREKYGKYISWLYEILKGLREIRLMSSERLVKKIFTKFNIDLIRIGVEDTKTSFMLTKCVDFVYLVAELCLYVFTAYLVLKNEITIGDFFVLIEFYRLISLDLKELIGKTTDLYRSVNVNKNLGQLPE